MRRFIELSPLAEEMAVRQAQARGQSVEEYLSGLVTDALARQAAEEPLASESDSLAFWEQQMDRRRPEPPL